MEDENMSPFVKQKQVELESNHTIHYISLQFLDLTSIATVTRYTSPHFHHKKTLSFSYIYVNVIIFFPLKLHSIFNSFYSYKII